MCDRCLQTFQQREDADLHTYLAPLHERKKKTLRDVDDLVQEDMEFSFYEGDRVDLSEILREQLELHEPMKHLCREECLGLCQRCGKNLNDGPCGCS